LSPLRTTFRSPRPVTQTDSSFHFPPVAGPASSAIFVESADPCLFLIASSWHNYAYSLPKVLTPFSTPSTFFSPTCSPFVLLITIPIIALDSLTFLRKLDAFSCVTLPSTLGSNDSKFVDLYHLLISPLSSSVFSLIAAPFASPLSSRTGRLAGPFWPRKYFPVAALPLFPPQRPCCCCLTEDRPL